MQRTKSLSLVFDKVFQPQSTSLFENLSLHDSSVLRGAGNKMAMGLRETNVPTAQVVLKSKSLLAVVL